jgi:hypothetical protein
MLSSKQPSLPLIIFKSLIAIKLMSPFAISIKLSDLPKYIYVKISGAWSIHTLKCLEDVKKEADEHAAKNILFDLVDMNIQSDSIRFYSGLKVAEVFKANYRVAVFLQKERINKFAENVAVNRGANFKVLDSKDEALDWLLK